jgi:SAM-dependent methyltransferase
MENQSGLRKFLKISFIYEILGFILGGKNAIYWLSVNFYNVQQGSKITDVGCGPGTLLKNYKKLFPRNINYHGIDPNENYIKSAKKEYGDFANFHHGTTETFINDSRFKDSDLILCSGVLHHIDDEKAKSLLDFVHCNLRTKTGRFLSIEPVHLMKETLFSKWMMNKDRGLHIRTEQEWKNLMKNSGLQYKTNIITGLIRIPYNHILIEARIG